MRLPFFLLSMQLGVAQSLSPEVKESIINLTNSFEEIKDEQLVFLDQLAFRVFKQKSKGMVGFHYFDGSS